MSNEPDAEKPSMKENLAISGIVILFLVFIAGAIIVAAFLAVPADVTYKDHGTGRAIDILAFEFGHGPGLWSHEDWRHVPVDNAIIYLANETYVYQGVDKFDDSYNPYIIIDVCDEYHAFQCGTDSVVIHGGPLAFSNYTYHENNNTVEYYIDKDFTFAKHENQYSIY